MSEKNCRVEVFSRVVGFFRPVQSWNKGKQEEFGDRKLYSIDKAGTKIKEDENSRARETVTS